MAHPGTLQIARLGRDLRAKRPENSSATQWRLRGRGISFDMCDATQTPLTASERCLLLRALGVSPWQAAVIADVSVRTVQLWCARARRGRVGPVADAMRAFASGVAVGDGNDYRADGEGWARGRRD